MFPNRAKLTVIMQSDYHIVVIGEFFDLMPQVTSGTPFEIFTLLSFFPYARTLLTINDHFLRRDKFLSFFENSFLICTYCCHCLYSFMLWSHWLRLFLFCHYRCLSYVAECAACFAYIENWAAIVFVWVMHMPVPGTCIARSFMGHAIQATYML